MSTETNDDGRVRASDGEREEYATIIRAAMSEGRLTLEEGEQRLATAYAAKFRDELPQITRDLPGGGRQQPAGAPGEQRPRGFRGHARRGRALWHVVPLIIAVILLTHLLVLGAHLLVPILILFLILGPFRWGLGRARFDPNPAEGWAGPPWARREGWGRPGPWDRSWGRGVHSPDDEGWRH